MKQNMILIIGLVLCGVVFADFASNLAKIETYIEQQGYTWQQVRDATNRQWYNHALAAGLDPNEIKQFSRSKSVLRSALVNRKKRAIVVAQATALLTHIRKVGSDVETIPLLREIYQNPEVYGVDPNAFN